MPSATPAAGATVAALLAPHDAGSPALLDESGAATTYGQLRAQVEATGETLRRRGVRPGEAVALALGNGPRMAAAFVSVSACAAAAPLHPGLGEREFRESLESLRAKALIVEAGTGRAAARAAADLRIPVLEMEGTGRGALFRLDSGPAARPGGARAAGREDPALLLHTSGTTARPKLVPLAHANLAASARNIAATLRLGPGDTCLNVMPLFHIHGLMGALLASLSAGAAVAAMPGFRALRFFRWLENLRPTWYTAVPTVHQAVLQRAARNPGARPPARLRLIRSSSAALPPAVLGALEQRFGCPVIESYGMTEAAHQMASNPLPPRMRKAGSVGPAAGPEMAVLGASGEPLPAGGTGELAIRGPNVMTGYADNPEANARAFCNGWFRTGDQGFRDADGYYTITGRLKELINRGGEKISPREVDEALLEHPAVSQAVAFAVPHGMLGEDVAAAVVLQDGMRLTQRQLREFAAERLAAYKVPRTVVFVDAIPKGPSGKLKRVGLARDLGLA